MSSRSTGTGSVIDAPAPKTGGKKKKSRGRRKKPIIRKLGLNGLDYQEVSALVAFYFCKGVKPGAIPRKLKDEHDVEIHEKSAWRWINEIAEKGGFSYNGSEALNLRTKIKERYPYLADVDVVATTMLETVASHGAHFVFQLLRQMVASGNHDDGIHIGVAGGRMLRSVTAALSQQFINTFTGEGDGVTPDVPTKLILHALGAGFSIDDPTTDPNAMFTRFLFDASIPVETKFVALRAPTIVHWDEFEHLKQLDGIRQAYEARGELDIVLTGLGTWKDETGLLRNYMQHCPDSEAELLARDVIGDLCWRPVGKGGIIDAPTKIRAMTLLELHELTGLIKRGVKVAVFCGPGRGGITKTNVLKVILDNPEHLINYLIIDSRTARELVS